MEQSEPITIRTNKKNISSLDALATALDRSRNYVLNQAIQQYLETNAWQVEKILAGIADMKAGRVHPAEKVFDEIEKEHGWQK